MTEEMTSLTIKLPRDLKDSFSRTCNGMDSTVSRELRQFMRDYIRRNGQKDLLKG